MSDEIQKWICLGCHREMSNDDMDRVNNIGKCPYCHSTYFKVERYEVK